MMTVLDWVLLLIVGASAALGAWRGLIAMAVSLAALLLAGGAAYLFGGDVGRSLASDGTPGWGAYLGGYALAFAAVWITVTLLGLLVRRIAHSTGLSGTDRVLGLVLGLARGVFFAVVLVLLLGLTDVPRGPSWRESTAVTLLLPAAESFRRLLPSMLARGMDLEGRGNSLHEALRADPLLEQALRPSLPLPVSTAPSPPAPTSLPRTPPEAAPQHDPTTVASGRAPEDKVH